MCRESGRGHHKERFEFLEGYQIKKEDKTMIKHNFA